MSDLEERVERIEDELGIDPEPEEYVLRAEAPERRGGHKHFALDEDLVIEDKSQVGFWANATVRGDAIDYFDDKWNVSDLSIVPRSEVDE